MMDQAGDAGKDTPRVCAQTVHDSVDQTHRDSVARVVRTAEQE